MSTTTTVVGEVIEQNSAIFLAQIRDEAGDLILADAISAIYYDVWAIPMTRSYYQSLFGALPASDASLVPPAATFTPAPVVFGRVLPVAGTIYDTPQLDSGWVMDTIGYNFKAMLLGDDFPEMPLSGYPVPQWQEVIFTLTPFTGDDLEIHYVVKKVYSLSNRKVGSGSGSAA
jgi:hypothetical protein